MTTVVCVTDKAKLKTAQRINNNSEREKNP